MNEEADKPFLEKGDDDREQNENDNPQSGKIFEKIGLLNKILFSWGAHLIKKRINSDLGHYGIPEYSKYLKAQFLYSYFQIYWSRYNKENYQLLRTIVAGNKSLFKASIVIMIIKVLLNFSQPLIIYFIISYLKYETEFWALGLVFILTFWFTKFITTVVNINLDYMMKKLETSINATLNAAIYKKALGFSLLNSRCYNIGNLANLLQIDSKRISVAVIELFGLFCLPVEIIFLIGLMYFLFGNACFLGLLVFLIIIIFNFILNKAILRLQKEILKAKDKRMVLVADILKGIKHIKITALENRFFEKVSTIRTKEISKLKKKAFLKSFLILSLYITPMISLLVVFSLKQHFGFKMTPESVFPLVSIFIILKEPLLSLPIVITFILESFHSMKKIQSFLTEDDFDRQYLQTFKDDFNTEEAVVISNGNFYWDKDSNYGDIIKKTEKSPQQQQLENSQSSSNINSQPQEEENCKTDLDLGHDFEYIEKIEKIHLKNLNISISKRKITGITGLSGSGKSSFLMCLVGEMKAFKDKFNSCIKVYGKIAIVPQNPFIICSSIRENIIFGSKYDAVHYEEILTLTCLNADLSSLEKGDQTIIGERGKTMDETFNIKVNMARALYSKRDIYLIDDIFSKIEFQTAKILFENAILNYLKGKTIIIVSSIGYILKNSDQIFLFEEGRVIDQGAYKELKEKKQLFSRIIQTNFIGDNEKPLFLEEYYEPRTGSNFNQTNLFKTESSKIISIIYEESSFLERDQSSKHTFEKKSSGNSSIKKQKSQEIEVISESSNQRFNLQGTYEKRGSIATDFLKKNKAKKEKERNYSVQFNPNRFNFNLEAVGTSSIEKSTRASLTRSVYLDSHPSFIVSRNDIFYENTVTGDLKNELFCAHSLNNIFQSLGGLIPCIIFILLSIFWVFTSLVSNIWLGIWCKSTTPSLLLGYLEGYAFLTLIYGACTWLRSLILSISGLSASKNLHNQMMRGILGASLIEFYEKVPIGRILNRFSKDVNMVDNELTPLWGNTFINLLFFIGDLVFCAYLTSFYIYIALGLYLLSFYIMFKIFRKTNKELILIENLTRTPIISHFSDTLKGIQIIRGFQVEEEFSNEMLNKIDNNINSTIALLGINSWFEIRMILLNSIIDFPCLTFSLIYWTSDPSNTGLLLVYLVWISIDLSKFVSNIVMLEGALESLSRCVSLTSLDIEPGYQNKKEKSGCQHILLTTAENDQIKFNSIARRGWPSSGEIEFQLVYIKYKDNTEFALKDINFLINPGEKIAIVGKKGAGKSTIFNSLLRIIEVSFGNILIDGVDISKISLNNVRENITVFWQEPFIFQGTLRENLDPLQQYDDEYLWRIIVYVSLDDYFSSREGLNTKFSANCSLSFGEKLLIGIARAILKRSKIILVDEATLMLDLKTESIIENIIKTLFPNTTVITMARRLNTIMNANRVLVIEQGRIIEYDTPSNLLKLKNSLFSRLWEESNQENT